MTIIDAAIEGATTVVWCDLLTSGPGRCPGCGTVGAYRDRVERWLTDLPVAGQSMQLRVRVPRYRCTQSGCERVIFCHDTSRLAKSGATTTRRCARFVLRRLISNRATVEHDSLSAAAEAHFIAQPSLSEQIRRLEQHLGVVLFVRTNRKLILTDAARMFVDGGAPRPSRRGLLLRYATPVGQGCR